MRYVISILIFVTLLFHNNSFCQSNNLTDSLLISSGLTCIQSEKAFDYLKSHKIFTKSFKLDTKVRPGWGYFLMLSKYMAGKLSVSEDSIGQQSKEKQIQALKYYQENVMYDDTLLFLNACTIKSNNKSKWTAIISKTDIETILIYLDYHKNTNKHGNGLIYLFFFNTENEITKFYDSYFIE